MVDVLVNASVEEVAAFVVVYGSGMSFAGYAGYDAFRATFLFVVVSSQKDSVGLCSVFQRYAWLYSGRPFSSVFGAPAPYSSSLAAWLDGGYKICVSLLSTCFHTLSMRRWTSDPEVARRCADTPMWASVLRSLSVVLVLVCLFAECSCERGVSGGGKFDNVYGYRHFLMASWALLM